MNLLKWGLSCFGSAIIGYLIGFYFDGITKINPNIKNLGDKMDSLTRQAKIAIDHINYYPNDGISCKVGYNPTLEDHIASVAANNQYGLKDGDRIYVIYKKSFGLNSQLVMIQTFENSPESSADIFLNKKMFGELGIDGKTIYKGVFNMYFKKIKE